MDAIEAVARALCRCQIGSGHDYNQKTLDYVVDEDWRDWLPEAQAAIAAYRPFVAAECAKVAEDMCGHLGDTYAPIRIATAIKETIR